jgi:trigger factor
MQVTIKDSQNLVNTISVTLSKDDYETDFTSELKKQRGKAQMKGFRKGKTPMSIMKKMYGQKVLVDVVMNKINTAINDYIESEKLNILGQPLPNKEQEQYAFDPNSLSEMEFLFDIGLTPEFEIQGLDNTIDIYHVEIPEETVEEELNVARRRAGKQVEMEDDIGKDDILTISAKEIEDGNVKKDGWETGFTVMVDSIANEELRAEILKGKKGMEFDFDIFNFEKDKDEKHVKKYLLNLDEEEEKEIGNDFRGKIDVVKRLQPAELDEEFYKNYFGNDEIKSEEEARAKVKGEIQSYYDNQAKMVRNRNLMDVLMEKTNITIPEDFMKRWLKETNKEVTDENLEKEFPAFTENLKWTLIKTKLSDKYAVTVEQQEVKEKLIQKVYQYMGAYPVGEEYITEMVNRLMSNQEQVNKAYEEIQADKIFVALEKDITEEEKSISLEDFKEEVKKLNERLSN